MKKTTKLILGLLIVAVIIVGCTVPEVVQNPDGTTSTNLVVDPRVTNAIETGKAINTVTAPFNPYSPVVTTILGLATVVTSAWGSIATFFSRRNKKLLATVVRGVELAPSPGPVKESIEQVSAGVGNQLVLDAAVQKILKGG